MDNISTLCLVGLFLVIIMMVLPRLMRANAAGRSPYSERGPEYPRYDDSDVESRGAFGAPADRLDNQPRRRTFDSPDIESRGSFGRPRRGGFSLRRSGTSQSSPPPAPRRRVDDDSIESRGGFGRDRD